MPTTTVAASSSTARRAAGVAQALQLADVAEHEHDHREDDQADDDPQALVAGQHRVDAVDLDLADRRQQRDQRQQVRVGARQRDAQHDVGDAVQPDEQRGVRQRRGRDGVLAGDEHRAEAGHDQQADEQQVHELAVARRVQARDHELRP